MVKDTYFLKLTPLEKLTQFTPHIFIYLTTLKKTIFNYGNNRPNRTLKIL